MDRLRLMAGSAAAACLGLAACGGADRPQRPAAPDARRARDLAVVSVVGRVGDDEVRGSGVVIDGDRDLILTSAHTLWGARSLKVTTALGILHGRIVARAPCDDLALVEAYPRIPGLVSLPAAPGAAPARGALLRSLGRRHTAPDEGSQGMAGIPVSVAGAAKPAPLGTPPGSLALDTPLIPEISGGPVVDAAGRLVGIAQAGTGPGVLVPWSAIQRRLGELKPGPQTVYVGWRNQYRCVSRQRALARRQHPGFRPADARLNVIVKPTRVPGTEGMDGG
jgi:S1-C subfamily serine protease